MKNIVLVLSTLLLFSSCNFKFEKKKIFTVNLKEISKKQQNITKFIETNEFGKALVFEPQKASDSIVVIDSNSNIRWGGVHYIVAEVWNDNDYSVILYIDFYKNNIQNGIIQQGQELNNGKIGPTIFAKVGILPKLKTKVIFPIKYLDGQTIFLPRIQRQLKATVLGHRLDFFDISKVCIRIEPVQSPEFKSKIKIASVQLLRTLPKPYKNITEPYVDEFGQWTIKDWEGKIKNSNELKSKMVAFEKQIANATYPIDWSKYGGWKKKQFNATGFFYTHHDGKRWWLVDPEGYAFISVGMDCVRPAIDGNISGREELLKWIPLTKEKQYEFALTQNKKGKSIDFLKLNYYKVYGNEWLSKWQLLTENALKDFGFNTIANWSDSAYISKAKTPYVLPLYNFPSTEIKLFRDFSDVFDPEYKRNAVKYAKQLQSVKNDPYLIGYFLDNEPHWAFGEHILAFEMFATEQNSYTKKEFIKWIASIYKQDIKPFNVDWKLNLSDFKDLEIQTFKEIPSEIASIYLKEFSGLMVDKYISVVCDEVKKIDSNHLNLGLRYAWISSELCYRAGKYFDVFSINGYNAPGPPPTDEISKRSGKPVMIGEFHFGSLDRGLPANGIQGAKNQKERGYAYRYYVENGFVRPELIGIHYFQLYDQNIIGRFDGENYNIGFMDICGQPYNELVNEAKKTHQQIYEVASGMKKPFDTIVEKCPQIYY